MRTLKILSISLIVAIIAVWATMSIWYVRNIRVTFDSESTKDIEYQVFYLDTVDRYFHEQQSVKKIVPAGVNKVEIILPTEKVMRFRLDFGSYPGAVTISNVMLVGDKVVNILSGNEKKYGFSSFIEKHQFLEDGTLHIVSNKSDPFIVYPDDLDVTSGTIINWSKLLQIALSTFFIILLLGLLMTRKKSGKNGREIS